MYDDMMALIRELLFKTIFLVAITIPASPLAAPTPPSIQKLVGNWIGVKSSLRRDDCCVASVSGLEDCLLILQEHFVDNGPTNIDLRARVHVETNAINDCLAIRRSVVSLQGDYDDNDDDNDDDDDDDLPKHREADHDVDRCTAALVELAKGVSLLANGSSERRYMDVFIRIVCASDYRAIDPMFHTDKAPLRAYVTLAGPGTEYMTRTCSPFEYASLRSLGQSNSQDSIRQAGNLDFIVMKGDHYVYNGVETKSKRSGISIMKKIWTRTCACVHRSPPGTGGRRVIVSLDLADGDDDREWYERSKRRNWRSGMTQRKSRLVA